MNKLSKIGPAVVTTVRSLIAESPIVRDVFDIIFASRGEITHRLGCVAAQDFREAASFIEIALKPLMPCCPAALNPCGKEGNLSTRCSGKAWRVDEPLDNTPTKV
jgi:hypothetical protein